MHDGWVCIPEVMVGIEIWPLDLVPPNILFIKLVKHIEERFRTLYLSKSRFCVIINAIWLLENLNEQVMV
jgi:hypothetical protein